MPCAFSSNGDGFASHDKTVPDVQDIETEFGMDVFPGPDELWRRYKAYRGIPDAQEELVTTNYDRLLEQVYDKGDGSHVQVLAGTTAMAVAPDPKRVTLIKIHGDFADPAHCILSKAQYDAAYGAGALDLQLPVPRILARYYCNNSLLFLGCNLRNDRTLQVFRATKLAAGDAWLPPHFSIEQAPTQLADLTARNIQLAQLGITAIWYPEKQYQFVDDILRLAKSELNFRQSQAGRARHFMSQ